MLRARGSPRPPSTGRCGAAGSRAEACGAAVTQPAASSAASRGRASPALVLCPCLPHPAAPCRPTCRPSLRGTSLGAAEAAPAPYPGHPPPCPPPLPARCARTCSHRPFSQRASRNPASSRPRLLQTPPATGNLWSLSFAPAPDAIPELRVPACRAPQAPPRLGSARAWHRLHLRRGDGTAVGGF